MKRKRFYNAILNAIIGYFLAYCLAVFALGGCGLFEGVIYWELSTTIKFATSLISLDGFRVINAFGVLFTICGYLFTITDDEKYYK